MITNVVSVSVCDDCYAVAMHPEYKDYFQYYYDESDSVMIKHEEAIYALINDFDYLGDFIHFGDDGYQGGSSIPCECCSSRLFGNRYYLSLVFCG